MNLLINLAYNKGGTVKIILPNIIFQTCGLLIPLNFFSEYLLNKCQLIVYLIEQM
jgi:hypothetical protein